MTLSIRYLLLSVLFLPYSSSILNGTEARSESITYLASIRLKIEDSSHFGAGHKCGATLITPQVVITSSSCLTRGETKNYLKPDTFRVVGGNTNRTEEAPLHYVSDVTRIIHHDSANHFTGKHNLALVTLENPVPKQKRFFKPIVLAKKLPKPGDVCTIVGWGSEIYPTPLTFNYTLQAKIAEVMVQDQKACSENKPLLPDGAICFTWNDTVGACHGDEGGPLIFKGKLVGVLLPTKNCDAHNESQFAVDIFQHLQWINESIYKKTVPHSGAFVIVLWDILLLLTALVAVPEVARCLFDWEG